MNVDRNVKKYFQMVSKIVSYIPYINNLCTDTQSALLIPYCGPISSNNLPRGVHCQEDLKMLYSYNFTHLEKKTICWIKQLSKQSLVMEKCYLNVYFMHSWAQRKLSPLSPLNPLNILLSINGPLLSYWFNRLND